MRATGTLFLSRTRPGVQRAADGTFALQLYAVDRIGAHQVEPWVVLWAGEEADAFWAAHRGHLVPGAALSVEVQRMRSHVVGRALPEIHAVASEVQLIQPQRAAHDHHQPAQAAA
jgi:hypothetical protein